MSTIRTFPTNLTAMVFGYKEKANFSVENEKEISTAPKVDFNPPRPPLRIVRRPVRIRGAANAGERRTAARIGPR